MEDVSKKIPKLQVMETTESSGPKKRGRKPLPPEERSKRGRKRVVQNELQERKEQGAPPLHISFVCENNDAAPESSTDTVAGGTKSFNPFADSWSSRPTDREPAAQESKTKKGKMMALDESDDDENVVVRQRPRIDVSSLTGDRCIELLGAHTDKKHWPRETQVACWNCTFPFDGIPIATPRRIDVRTRILVGCYGVFCSFNCAKRHLLEKSNSWQQLQLLTYLHKKVLGNVVKISAAPPSQVLDRFGGYMTIDEYRKDFIMLPPQAEMFDPSMRRDKVELLQQHCIPSFQIVHHSHNQQLITNSIQEKKREKYDRTRPLPGSESLANSMGITRG